MRLNLKKLAPAAALALALQLVPAASKAQSVSFYGQFPAPHGSVTVYANNGPYWHHHRYYRPYYGHGYYRPYFHPYRSVRVFVPFPFPHYVVRRVYDPYYDPY